MLRAFHAALRNSPVNTKNQAVKVNWVELQLLLGGVGTRAVVVQCELAGALDSVCFITAPVSIC